MPEERRASERFAPSSGVACDFASPVLEDFGPVRVKNISAEGIGIILTEPLAEDMLLVLRLVNSKKNFTKTMVVRVTHLTPQSGGTYLVGGTLEPPLTYDELTNLVVG